MEDEEEKDEEEEEEVFPWLRFVSNAQTPRYTEALYIINIYF
jgi:hypothetical protein